MKKNLNIILFFVVAITMSCDENENGNSDYLLELETTSETGEESGGSKQVVFSLNQPAIGEVIINFSIAGSASLNGDYKLNSSSPLTIEEGETSATIDFELIDEPIIEQENETIVFKIDESDISGVTFSADQPALTYEFTITDNDEIPDDNLQVDLTWDLGEGEDIDETDLDLLIAVNVVIENDEVTDATILDNISSYNSSGFESINIGSGDIAEDEYYIVVYYNEGDASVDYTLGYSNSKDIGDEVEFVEGNFNSDEEGYSIFYGPISTPESSGGRVGLPRLYKNFRRDMKHTTF